MESNYRPNGKRARRDPLQDGQADQSLEVGREEFANGGSGPCAWFPARQKGGGNYFYYDIPIPIWSPYDAPTTSTTTSGAIAGRTLYAAQSFSDGTKETEDSQEATQVVAGNDLITVTVADFPSGVSEARIYLGIASGTLSFGGTESSTGGTWTEPFSTVDADSNSGQKVLNVAATTNFEAGQNVVIGEGTARDENKVIDTVQAGVSLTMTANLDYTHTGAQADEVYLDPGTGTSPQTSNGMTDIEYKVHLLGEPTATLIGTGVYSLTLDIEEMF